MASKKNYQIGRGKVYFSLFKAGTQEPAGFRFLGNCPGFNLTVAIETLDHYASTEGIREKDESIILQTNRTGSITSDEISTENVALFFLGTAGTVAQTSATAATYTITDAIPGMMYRVGATTAAPTGFRNLSSVVVTVAGSPKVLGTDYTFDLARGLITIVGTEDDGTIVDGDDVLITYNRAAGTRKQVLSGTSQVEGAIQFISASPTGTVQNDLYLPYVKLSPNGDFSLITDSDWTQLSLSVEALVPDVGGAAIIVDGQPVLA